MADNPSINATAVAQVPAVFFSMLPSMRELHAVDTAQEAHELYREQVAAFAICAGIGVGLSVVTESPTPALLAVVTATAMVAVTHYFLSEIPENKSKDTDHE